MSEERNELNELNTTQTDHEYGGSEIQVLEGLEAVRKRPGMYIGSTSESGLHHLVYEIVDNSIDEALAGHCTDITVTINPGNTITVTDNGRGIPVDIQPQTGKPALEVVFTILHAGGKFGGGGYKVSGGLHGVGASVVNALSEWLEVQVHKNGEIYEMKFARGKITQEMRVVGKTDHTGTTVTFKPDPEMFETLEYSYDTLHTRMREEAFLNAGLRINTVDLRPGKEQRDSMCYEGGIREYVSWLNQNKIAGSDSIAVCSVFLVFAGNICFSGVARLFSWHMAELEQTLYLSLKQMVCIRMLEAGIADFAILSLFLILTGDGNPGEVLASLTYMLVPFLWSDTLYLHMLVRLRNTSSGFRSFALGLLCGILALFPLLWDSAYQPGYFIIWQILAAAGLLMCIAQICRLLGSIENGDNICLN